ncbi:MAG: DUF1648 domain-containing protein [Actinomyces sp.]|jgi:hypothetical protein|uniref:DUF1648 domain-containing protein n=1 Tax=Lancefieldella parvula TaxID=1382 RepID=A0A9E7D3H3_9ACTN|nr:DUF1648 domain-containing protein [Actinomyces sp.]UQF77967.1 MAG: DUF1648 domain-containing protein [Lancefieldella parvula]
MAKLMKGDKGYFDKAMSLLAVFLGILPAVVLLVLWNSIPQSIPAHWFGDSVDRWGQKWELLILPVICLAIGLLLSFFSVRRNAEDSNDKERKYGIASLMVTLFTFSALSLVHIYLSLQSEGSVASKFDGATLFYVIDGLVCILLGIVFPATLMSMSSRAPRRFSGKYAKGLLISAGVVILLFCGTGLLRGYAALLLMFAMIIVPAVLISVSSYRNQRKRFL